MTAEGLVRRQSEVSALIHDTDTAQRSVSEAQPFASGGGNRGTEEDRDEDLVMGTIALAVSNVCSGLNMFAVVSSVGTRFPYVLKLLWLVQFSRPLPVYGALHLFVSRCVLLFPEQLTTMVWDASGLRCPPAAAAQLWLRSAADVCLFPWPGFWCSCSRCDTCIFWV